MFRAIVAISLAAASLAAGDFGKITQHKVGLIVARPPDVLLRGKSIAVRIEAGERSFTEGQTLVANLQSALAAEFTPSPKPDSTVALTVTAWSAPKPQFETLTESRNVKVGKKTVMLFGKATEVDDIQLRNVPVKYFFASGSLTVAGTTTDQSGTVLDTFQAPTEYKLRQEMEVNGVSNNRSVPTFDQLRLSLVLNATRLVARRYIKTNETLEARLAVDKELRDGNELAMAGQWDRAIAQWNGAALKKNQGDRLFNMAVGYEALAYAKYDKTRDVTEAAPLFTKAIELYGKAIQVDPEEKYFRQARERVGELEKNFTRAQSHKEADEREKKQLTEELLRRRQEEQRKKLEEQAKLDEERRRKESEEAALRDTRPDSPAETTFRNITRARLKSRAHPPTEAEQADLARGGVDTFRLQPLEARRVVFQESTRIGTLVKATGEYKQVFSELAGDGTITAAERESLSGLAQALKLSSEDIDPLEGTFTFKDLTKAAPPPPVNAAKPPGVKPIIPSYTPKKK